MTRHWHTVLLALLVMSVSARAETVFVKYAGLVDLDKFSCKTVTRSSLVRRVCYRPDNYMVILLGSTYYHYCNIPSSEVAGLLYAESMGRYYNAYIKGRYDCRR